MPPLVSPSVVPSPWRRFLDLPADEKRLLGEAWGCLLAVTVRLRLSPRRTVARALAAPPAPKNEDCESPGTFQGSPPTFAQAIALAVARAAAHHLWPMTCLPRALALQGMLARRGISALLRIGVRPAPGGPPSIAAHAWVEVDGVALGEPAAIEERFLPLLPAAAPPP